jgi:hypothetical protein
VDLRGRELQLVASEVRTLEEALAGPAAAEGNGNGRNRRTPPPGGSATRPAARAPAGTAAEPVANGGTLFLEVPTEDCTDGLVSRLKEALAAHPGNRPVVLRLLSSESATTLRLSDGYRVDGSAGLQSELRGVLGPGGSVSLGEASAADRA